MWKKLLLVAVCALPVSSLGALDEGKPAPPIEATLVYLSPGVNVKLTDTSALYGYVQVPIYQHVNGYQIEPRWSASLGVRFAL